MLFIYDFFKKNYHRQLAVVINPKNRKNRLGCQELCNNFKN